MPREVLHLVAATDSLSTNAIAALKVDCRYRMSQDSVRINTAAQRLRFQLIGAALAID